MSVNAKKDSSSAPAGPSSPWESIRSWLVSDAKLIGEWAVAMAKWIRRNFRKLVDTGTKLIAASAVAVVTYLAATYQSQAARTSLINQREQAESQLRASMLSDLVEPIMGKNPADSQDAGANKNGAASQETNLERQLLLAEMVTLNFHDHFEFKPLLVALDAKLQAEGMKGEDNLASDARRVIDRQINMLTSIDGVSRNGHAGYGAKVTKINLFKSRRDPSPAENCITEGQINWLAHYNKTLNMPASICLSSPDNKMCLFLTFYWDTEKNAIAMSPMAYPNDGVTRDCRPKEYDKVINLDSVQKLDVSHLSIFDFPLTDNTKISYYFSHISFPHYLNLSQHLNEYKNEYRFSLSLYQFTGKDQPIVLEAVWFPQGYVTERERPPAG